MFGIVGLVLSSGRGANLNMRAAFLEVVNDALGSVAVIMSAVVIALTGSLWVMYHLNTNMMPEHVMPAAQSAAEAAVAR